MGREPPYVFGAGTHPSTHIETKSGVHTTSINDIALYGGLTAAHGNIIALD